ncbi:COX15/CtaA family protein [Candidatus Palauibacter sp.]|uniref:COX15/CtaA family protein n=1 Tax=Candidatus Palauibacter sp. TaxID=3101350 RepID=UPI003B52B464
MPSPPFQSGRQRHARIIAAWLLVGCALVAATLVVGGVTRLTGSGLSMVDWEPVSGVVPPMSAEGWEREFAAYRDSPEYRLVNQGMSLGEFKRIFWFEYTHRLLGRVIGLVFIIPFAVFLARRMIPRSLVPRLLLLLALGGAQGLLGWWMVQSGLVDIPRVSPYRLTAHLALAVLVYALTLWTALSLLRPGTGDGDAPAESGGGIGRWAGAVLGLASLTLLSGGFVAGLDAGLVYNTFPRMGDGWIPPDFFGANPWWLSPFEDRATVQFNHRVLAMLLLGGVTALWWVCARHVSGAARTWAHAGFAAVWVQAALGVATLLLFVPIPLAVLHQANALVLFTALLGLAFELRRPGLVGARHG